VKCRLNRAISEMRTMCLLLTIILTDECDKCAYR